MNKITDELTPLQTFYQEPNALVPVYRGRHGQVDEVDLALSSARIYRTDVPSDMRQRLGEKISELYDSVQQITVRVNGQLYNFEFAHIKQGDGDDTELEVSTYSSSSENPGNVSATAFKAVANPTRSYFYVASPGNGLTSPLFEGETEYRNGLTAQMYEGERKYFRHTSRMLHETDKGVEPLPIVTGLNLALEECGITVTRLRSDSAGAILERAWAAVYGKGAIRAVHQNVPTNLVDKNPLTLGYGMLWKESHTNGPRQTSESPDVLMAPLWDDFTRSRMTDTYRQAGFKPGKSKAMLAANLFALCKGPSSGDPAVGDMRWLLRANDEAKVLFTLGRDDPLISGADIDERMRYVCQDLSQYTKGDVTAAIIEGATHGLHTFTPQFVAELSRVALG